MSGSTTSDVDTIREVMAAAEKEIRNLRRALVAHHNLATLSDDVIREYDWRECPVCKRAREEP
jgi:hypothetical protein